jgi:2Fe-2S ferredoxin
MCATCHVYVDDRWIDRLPAISDEEDALLDGTASERLPTSRLSCQIKIAPELDGLVLRLPQRQV